jgi:DNA-binding MarR family transcriptional regulator
MGIETEIKQSSFRNDYHKVLVNVIYTSNWVIENMKHLLQAEDITHQQFNILRILRASNKPLSTLELRDRMIDKMSDTSRIVERLLKKGLVHKQTCKHDKRLVDITISENGLQLLTRLDTIDADIDSMPASITLEEAATLNDLLDKLRLKS